MYHKNTNKCHKKSKEKGEHQYGMQQGLDKQGRTVLKG